MESSISSCFDILLTIFFHHNSSSSHIWPFPTMTQMSTALIIITSTTMTETRTVCHWRSRRVPKVLLPLLNIWCCLQKRKSSRRLKILPIPSKNYFRTHGKANTKSMCKPCLKCHHIFSSYGFFFLAHRFSLCSARIFSYVTEMIQLFPEVSSGLCVVG